jgi:D-alanyl-D-alanine carboxypeptidase (penicillin-binding protein 5/6)
MIGCLRIVALLVGMLLPFSVTAAPTRDLTATAAILVDSQTGQILWQRNPDLPLPPASTTKVLTALLAVKSGRLHDSFPVSKLAAETSPSKIYVRSGWRVRLRDLVYASLLNSANDASSVIAEGLGGSIAGFAAMMNAEARALGAVRSNFVNPHGLPAQNHYSTARDLVTVMRAALRLPLLREVLQTRQLAIAPTHGSTRRIALRSHNRFLVSDHPSKLIGKTGWTRAAKKCFVGAARMGDREVLVALLGSRDLWGDLERMLDGRLLPDSDSPPVLADEVDWSLASRDAIAPQPSGDDEEPGVTDRYEIRLATFRTLDSANRLRRAVVKDGYGADVLRVGSGSRARFQVTVGDYPSFSRAQQDSRRLDRAHRVRSVVVKRGT